MQGDSMGEYIAKHSRILAKLDPTNDLEKVETFAGGLSGRIKSEIILRYPNTVEEAFNIAKALFAGGAFMQSEPMDIGFGSTSKVKVCFFCKKKGHVKKDCFSFKKITRKGWNFK